MYLAAYGERVYGGRPLAADLASSSAAREAPEGVTVPDILVAEIGFHKLYERDTATIDELSMAFRAIHSIYMDRSPSASLPLLPQIIALCITDMVKDTINPNRSGPMLDALLGDEYELIDGAFDLHTLAQAPVSATLILPQSRCVPAGRQEPQRLPGVTQNMINKMATVSLAHSVGGDARTLRNIVTASQEPPNILTASNPDSLQPLYSYYYWGASVSAGRGLGLLLSRQLRPPEFERVMTPLAV